MRIVTILLLIVLFASCARQLELDDRTIAIVGEHVISLDDYRQRYIDYLYLSLMKDNLVTRRQIAQNMVNEILLHNYDDNSALENDPEYRKHLAWADKQMVLGYLKDREVYAKIEVTDTEVRQAFSRAHEKIAARHLYATNEEEAFRLYDALQKGADFNLLARQVFTDSLLKNNGGFLGYFTWGDMDPAFENAAYSLQPGQISEPVKTAHGYSIIKVEDRLPHPLLTETEFLKSKNKYERLLKISKKKAAEEAFIGRYFDEQALSFNEAGLSALWEAMNDPTSQKEGTDLQAMVAVYQDEHINVSDALNMLAAVPRFHKKRITGPARLKVALKGLIIQEKLLEVARQLGYDKDPEVARSIKQSHENLFIEYKRRLIADNMSVPDSTLRDYYQKNPDVFVSPRMINIREILVDSRRQALQLKGMLLKGADFTDLAGRYSLRRWSAQRGGEIGLSGLDRFGMIRDQLWQADVDEIVGPLDIDGFWGLFKILEKRESSTMDFEQVRQQVEQQYKNKHNAGMTMEYIAGLYKKVDVRVNEQLIRSMAIDDPLLH